MAATLGDVRDKFGGSHCDILEALSKKQIINTDLATILEMQRNHDSSQAMPNLMQRGLDPSVTWTKFGRLMLMYAGFTRQRVCHHRLLWQEFPGKQGIAIGDLLDQVLQWKDEQFQPIAPTSRNYLSKRDDRSVDYSVLDLLQISIAIEELLRNVPQQTQQKVFHDVFDAEIPPVPEGRFLHGCVMLLEPFVNDQPDGLLSRLVADAEIAEQNGNYFENQPRPALPAELEDLGPFLQNATHAVDVEAHESIVEGRSAERTDKIDGIQNLFPEDIVIGEENTNQWRVSQSQLELAEEDNQQFHPAQPGRFVHNLDAVDGTLMYIRHKDWAISLGLGVVQQADETHGENVVWKAGLVYLPKTRELFLATRTHGILIDFVARTVRPLRGSKVILHHRTTIGTHLSTKEKNQKAMRYYCQHQLPILNQISERLLMEGVGARSLAHIADGRLDAFYNPRSGGSWDSVAGFVLVEAACGKTTNELGEKFGLQSQGLLVAGNPTLHANLLAYLGRFPSDAEISQAM